MAISPLASEKNYAWQATKHFSPASSRTKIDRVYIHHNASTNFDAVPNIWLTRQASAHYQVGDGRIRACLDESLVGWSVGNFKENARSISVEHVNSKGAPSWAVSENTINTGARLVAEICLRNNIPIDRNHILGHKEVKSTQCPGGINVDDYVARVKRYATEMSAPVANINYNILKGMEMQYTFEITNKDGKNRNVIWFVSGMTVIPLGHPDELHHIRDAYKKITGSNMLHYNFNQAAPWYIRIPAVKILSKEERTKMGLL